MANEKCVVKFLAVSLVGFIVLLISNIAGPFDSLPYKIVSIVILGCIVLMGTLYFGKRLFSSCVSCKKRKPQNQQNNTEGGRSRQSTAPQEELLEIFPELRRLSSHNEDDVNTEESQEEPQEGRPRLLSIVAEENEDEIANGSLTPQPQQDQNQHYDVPPRRLHLPINQPDQPQTSFQQDNLQTVPFQSEHPEAVSTPGLYLSQSSPLLNHLETSAQLHHLETSAQLNQPETACSQMNHLRTESPQSFQPPTDNSASLDIAQIALPQSYHPEAPTSPQEGPPQLYHSQSLSSQPDRSQEALSQAESRPSELSEGTLSGDFEVYLQSLVRSRQSSLLSRRSSDVSFESAMDCEYPPPYDSTLPFYNDVVTSMLQPGDRSTL